MVPFSQDDYFVGREGVLAQINGASKQAIPPKHKRFALVGLGGVG
jgi:hypothetical protein